MLKKLINGELGLKSTFWKFGFLGLIILRIFVKVFEALLNNRLRGISVVEYYSKYFNPLKMDTLALVLTIGYLSCLFIFFSYSIMVVLGVWRSSSSFEKSGILRFFSRLFVLVLVSLGILSVF